MKVNYADSYKIQDIHTPRTMQIHHKFPLSNHTIGRKVNLSWLSMSNNHLNLLDGAPVYTW